MNILQLNKILVDEMLGQLGQNDTAYMTEEDYNDSFGTKRAYCTKCEVEVLGDTDGVCVNCI